MHCGLGFVINMVKLNQFIEGFQLCCCGPHHFLFMVVYEEGVSRQGAELDCRDIGVTELLGWLGRPEEANIIVRLNVSTESAEGIIQQVRGRVVPCCRRSVDTADPSPVSDLTDESPILASCPLSVSFSLANVPVSALSVEFSIISFLFSRSSSITFNSRSDIRDFFRSRAVCAATLFFSFLRIIFSSCDR